MTALHSVAGIPKGSAGTEDLVNTVQILLDHGADLTFSTYQVMHNVVEDNNLEELFVNVVSRPSLLLDECSFARRRVAGLEQENRREVCSEGSATYSLLVPNP